MAGYMLNKETGKLNLVDTSHPQKGQASEAARAALANAVNSVVKGGHTVVKGGLSAGVLEAAKEEEESARGVLDEISKKEAPKEKDAKIDWLAGLQFAQTGELPGLYSDDFLKAQKERDAEVTAAKNNVTMAERNTRLVENQIFDNKYSRLDRGRQEALSELDKLRSEPTGADGTSGNESRIRELEDKFKKEGMSDDDIDKLIAAQKREKYYNEQAHDSRIQGEDVAEYNKLSDEGKRAVETLAMLKNSSAVNASAGSENVMQQVSANAEKQQKALAVLKELGIDADRADELAESVSRDINAKNAKALQDDVSESAIGGFWEGSANWALARGANLVGGTAGSVDAALAMMQRIASGGSRYNSIDPNLQGYAMSNIGNAITGAQTEHINENYGKALGLLYQGGTGFVDNLLRAHVLGGVNVGDADKLLSGYTGMQRGVNSFLSAASAFQEAFQDASSRGGTPAQALLVALGSASLESVTENMGWDRVFEAADPTTKAELVKYILWNAAGEPMEELSGLAGNKVLDGLVMGDKSEAHQQLREMIDEQGLSSKEAMANYAASLGEEALNTIITSYISGIGMNAVEGVSKYKRGKAGADSNVETRGSETTEEKATAESQEEVAQTNEQANVGEEPAPAETPTEEPAPVAPENLSPVEQAEAEYQKANKAAREAREAYKRGEITTTQRQEAIEAAAAAKKNLESVKVQQAQQEQNQFLSDMANGLAEETATETQPTQTTGEQEALQDAVNRTVSIGDEQTVSEKPMPKKVEKAYDQITESRENAQKVIDDDAARKQAEKDAKAAEKAQKAENIENSYTTMAEAAQDYSDGKITQEEYEEIIRQGNADIAEQKKKPKSPLAKKGTELGDEQRARIAAEKQAQKDKVDAAKDAVKTADAVETVIGHVQKQHMDEIAALVKKHKGDMAAVRAEIAELAKQKGKDKAKYEKEMAKLAKAVEKANGDIEKLKDQATIKEEQRKQAKSKKDIVKTVNQLRDMLAENSKKNKVLAGMQAAVSKAIGTWDTTSVDYESKIANTDKTIERYTKQVEKADAAVDNLIADAESVQARIDATDDVALKDELNSRLDSLYAEIEKQQGLSDEYTAKLEAAQDRRDEYQAKLDEHKIDLEGLRDSLEDLAKSEDPDIAAMYADHNGAIYDIISQAIMDVGDTPISQMDSDQLTAVANAYKVVLHEVKTANKEHYTSFKQTISEIAHAIISERSDKVENRKKSVGIFGRMGEGISGFNFKTLKPVYAFDRMGAHMKAVGQMVLNSENDYGLRVQKAADFAQDLMSKYKYSEWKLGKTVSVTSENNGKVNIPLSSIMNLYALSKRNQAMQHITSEKGGIIIDNDTDVDGKKNRDNKRYVLSKDTIESICQSALTDEQRAYVDEMLKYMDVTAEQGNETSMSLYGIELFGEDNYFQIEAANGYGGNSLMGAEQNKSITNLGITNKTNEKANGAIMLRGFNDVWASHVSTMATYSSFAENVNVLNRVLNYGKNGDDNVRNSLGVKESQYIDNLINDITGQTKADERLGILKFMMSAQKGAAVAANISVVMKQGTSEGRAYAELPIKYFSGKEVEPAGSKKSYEQLMKYSGIACIKNMGAYDIGMGRSAASYMVKEQHNGIGGVLKGFVMDSDYRNEALSYLAGKADERTWGRIWEASKRYVADTTDLTGEDLLIAAAEKFNDVIRKTQVYDSPLSRSDVMRSKSALAQMATAFQAEPTTTMNMVESALINIVSGDKAQGGRQLFGVAASMIMEAAVSGVINGVRKKTREDEKDESLAEEIIGEAAGALANNFNPLTYFPWVKDVYSVLSGESIERTDMTIVGDIVSATKKWYNLENKDTSEMSEEELDEYQKEVYSSIFDAVNGIFQCIGTNPARVAKDVGAVYDLGQEVVDLLQAGLSGTKYEGDYFMEMSANTVLNGIKDSLNEQFPFFAQFDLNKGNLLYKAETSDDDVFKRRMERAYSSDKALKAALAKTLREHDDRVSEAASALHNGDKALADSIMKTIINDGDFRPDVVNSAVQSAEEKLNDKPSKDYTEEQKSMAADVQDITGFSKLPAVVQAKAINYALAEDYTKPENAGVRAIDFVSKAFASEFDSAMSDVTQAWKNGEQADARQLESLYDYYKGSSYKIKKTLMNTVDGQAKNYIEQRDDDVPHAVFLTELELFKLADKEVDDAGGNGTDKQNKFKYYLEKAVSEGVLPKNTNIDSVEEAFKFFNMNPATSSQYSNLRGAGLSADTAIVALDYLDGIVPKPGKTSASNSQKADAMWSAKDWPGTDKERENAARSYLTESQNYKLDTMLDSKNKSSGKEFTVDDYLSLLRIWEDYYYDGKSVKVEKIGDKFGSENANMLYKIMTSTKPKDYSAPYHAADETEYMDDDEIADTLYKKK